MVKIAKRTKLSLGIFSASIVLLASGIFYDVLPAGLLGLAGLFMLFLRRQNYSRKTRVVAVFFGNLALMELLTFWLKDITPDGWTKIWVLPPYVWLLSALFLVSITCSLTVALFYWLSEKYIFGLARRLYQQAYLWALWLTLAEVIRSTTFSLLTKHGSAPIQPNWNLFSVAQMASGNVLGFLGRGFGLWGLVFIVNLLATVLYLVVDIARHWQKYSRQKLLRFSLAGSIGLVVLIGISWLTFTNTTTPTSQVQIVAVSQPTLSDDYFTPLASSLSSSQAIPTIVALPEYSFFVNTYAVPYYSGAAHDGKQLLSRLPSKDIYFVGTEDASAGDKRYTETYVLNSSGQKIKRQVKTFLVPGGEYVIGWAGAAIKWLDIGSYNSFVANRSRTVIGGTPPVEASDPFAEHVGIGACSTLLMPYHYRKEVANGATFLVANVSFEEFPHAPQYEHIANRFAQLIAKSTDRAIAIGARGGVAKIYNQNGKVIAQTTSLTPASAVITERTDKTIYDLLCDTAIVALLCLPVGILITSKSFLSRRPVKN